MRIVGLRGLPAAGEDVLVVESEERAKAVLQGRERRAAAATMKARLAEDRVHSRAQVGRGIW